MGFETGFSLALTCYSTICVSVQSFNALYNINTFHATRKQGDPISPSTKTKSE